MKEAVFSYIIKTMAAGDDFARGKLHERFGPIEVFPAHNRTT